RTRHAIETALAREASVDVRVTPSLDAKGGLRVEYALAPFARQAKLNLAIVERDLVSQVLRGENRGRTLHHDNVVRTFLVVGPQAGGSGVATLAWRSDLKRDRPSLVAYLQDTKTQRILGAAAVDLAAPVAAR